MEVFVQNEALRWFQLESSRPNFLDDRPEGKLLAINTYMYVYMYICIGIYVYVDVDVYMYICIHTYTYIHMYMYVL